MQYIGNVIRPPSEANSIILQVTVGCSYNKCTFCGAYKDVPFSVKDEAVVSKDIDFAASYCKNQKRLFVADGDALILTQKRLVKLFTEIHSKLPWVRRISLYGNARSIRSKSIDQLKQLRSLGLDRIYLGLESGNDTVLASVKKGETGASMIEAAAKVKQAGVFLSATALLGLGSKTHSSEHAKQTAEVLTKMAPNQIALLTLMILGNSPLGKDFERGNFILPDSRAILQELYHLVSNLGDIRCQFHANHASSYLPLQGRLPRDKERLLTEIDMALSGDIELVPETWRAL